MRLSAGERWRSILASHAHLITHNYLVLELTTLLQHRLGMEPVRDLLVEVLPVCTVQWVSETIHAQALHTMLAAGRRNACDTAFAFDPHFVEQGFVTSVTSG